MESKNVVSDPLHDNADEESKSSTDSNGSLFHDDENPQMKTDLDEHKVATDGDLDPLNALNDEECKSTDSDEPIFKDDVDPKGDTKDDLGEDLYVSVSDPDKRVHTMETYIAYKVTTKTTRSTFDDSEFVVQRRYTDFVWLAEKLEEEYPTFIIPPLPSKFIVKGMLDRFSTEFTNTRCLALNKFLVRISKHPVVSFSECLKTFLTSQELSSVKKQGIFSRMSGSLKWSRVNNPDYEPINETVSMFGEKMAVMDRIGERLLAEKKEFVDELKQLCPTFSEWGQSEDEVVEPIMASVTSCLESCAAVAEENVKQHERDFIPPLKEYILYADVVKQALKRRDVFESQFEKCDEELRLKRSEKENFPKSDQSYSIGAFMGKSPELVREQKEEKMTQQIEQLSLQREKLCDDLEKANSNFQADMDRWKKCKTKDMATVFSNFAKEQVSYHNNCFAAWENILPTMQTSSAATCDAGEPKA